jgi:hypothetical protein
VSSGVVVNAELVVYKATPAEIGRMTKPANEKGIANLFAKIKKQARTITKQAGAIKKLRQRVAELKKIVKENGGAATTLKRRAQYGLRNYEEGKSMNFSSDDDA